MPNYSVTTPDNQNVSVTAPPNADSSSIFSFVKDALFGGSSQTSQPSAPIDTSVLSNPYIGNPNLSRQAARAGVGTRPDNFTGPSTAFLGGLLGTAPDEQGGSVLDPSSARNSSNAAMAGYGLGSVLQSLPLVKGLFSLGDAASDALSFASRSAKIRPPQPLPQRPFSSDYNPENFAQPNGSQLTTDIGGNPLTARYVAGRRSVGGGDQALNSGEINDILGLLDVPSTRVPAREIGGDAGRYGRVTSPDGEVTNRIRIDQGLDSADLVNVQSHEFGHAINDMAGVYNPATKYGQIPTNGIVGQLDHNYDLLNNRQLGNPAVPRKPRQQATPGTGEYPKSDWDAEKLAEAVRGYATDPNYFKTVAPDVAARVREFVNINPRLKNIVQFNSAGAGLGFGLLGSNDDPAN